LRDDLDDLEDEKEMTDINGASNVEGGKIYPPVSRIDT
jgi:hypothetical protein